MARLMFEMAGETALLLVTQAGRRFLHGGAIADQLMGGALALFVQLGAGVLAHVPAKMPVQGAHGDATVFGQGRGRPLGLPGEFRPVLNLLQSFLHKCVPGKNTVIQSNTELEAKSFKLFCYLQIVKAGS